MSPICLKGKNLGKRQHELNKLVQEAYNNKMPFEEIKKLEEETDIDRIYKIDVASKIRNVDYLMETLKSNDSLYISRVLKCNWLFQDPQYSSIMNPDYLHDNVLPAMSSKMSTKLLNTLTVKITDENRAEAFCDYCMRLKKETFACKFLKSTSESYRKTFINKNCKMILSLEVELNNISRNSFELAEAFLKQNSCTNFNILKKLRHLYHISPEKYIYLLEKYCKAYSANINEGFGVNMTKEILKKNRVNVIRNPPLYEKCLNTKIILESLTIEELKVFISDLFPTNVEDFWKYNNFIYSKMTYFEQIPLEERFLFVKDVFETKYLGECFETNDNFYDNNYYLKLMTDQQKHDWASEKLKKGFIGKDTDYNLYKYLIFSLAFDDIKDVIKKMNHKRKRMNIILIALESTKTENDLEQLLKYFWERHANEEQDDKIQFLNKVLGKYNPFLLGDSCWDWLHKLFASVDMYSNKSNNRGLTEAFITTTLFYNIIHDKEMHEYLVKNIKDWPFGFIINILSQIPENIHGKIFSVLIEKMTNACSEYSDFTSKNIYASKNRGRLNVLREIIESMLIIYNDFNKDLDGFPEEVKALAKLDKKHLYNDLFQRKIKKAPIVSRVKINVELMRALKSDFRTFVHNIPKLKKRCMINVLLKKLKVYFPDNNECLKFFYNQLSNEKAKVNSLRQAVVAITVLEKSDNLKRFVSKYKPEVGKIQHHTIDQRVKNIQKCICRYMYFARPHLPLDFIMSFVIGDYTHFFIPTVGAIEANLPSSEFKKLVQILLDNPFSIQKHGLRLAFKHFRLQELKQLTHEVWVKTKNVSIRLLLFKSVYDLLIKKFDEDMFEIIKMFMLDLNIDDSNEIFRRLHETESLQSDFINEYLTNAYKAVNQLPDTPKAWEYRNNVLNKISLEMYLIDVDFLEDLFINYIKDKLVDKGVLKSVPSYKSNTQDIVFDMLVRYLLTNETNEIRDEKIEKFVNPFVQILSENWKEVFNGNYVYQDELNNLRINLEKNAFTIPVTEIDVTPIFDFLLDFLKEKQPKYYRDRFGLRFKLATLLIKAFYAAEEVDDCSAHSYLIAEQFGNLLSEYLIQAGVYLPLALNIAKDFKMLLKELYNVVDIHHFGMHVAKNLFKTKNTIAIHIGLYIYLDSLPDDSNNKDGWDLPKDSLPQDKNNEHRKIIFDLYAEVNDDLKRFILYEFAYDKKGFDLNSFICLEK